MAEREREKLAPLPTEGREAEQAHKVARFPRSSDPDSVPRASRGGDRSEERQPLFRSIHDALASSPDAAAAAFRIFTRPTEILALSEAPNHIHMCKYVPRVCKYAFCLAKQTPRANL